MYTEFYNLTTSPFQLVPDERFYFGSEGHSKALSYLKFGLQQGEGFIVVTGEVGAGKSTLVSRLFAELDRSSIAAALIATTQITPREALRLILAAFQVKSIPANKASMLGVFETFLRDQRAAGRQVLLAIDEAQGLPMGTLEELRMLSNILIDGRSAFQCFLLGQPQFMKLMARRELEQFRQRVVASCHLGPLTADETRTYIVHRLNLSGWSGDPAISDKAFRRIFDATGGIPRRINTLCNRLFFFGALERLHEIDETSVAAVLEDLTQEAINPLDAEGDEKLPDDELSGTSEELHSIATPRRGKSTAEILARLARIERRIESCDKKLQHLVDAEPTASRTMTVIAGQRDSDADGGGDSREARGGSLFRAFVRKAR
jgi:general secretion pathway protein A